MMFQFLIGRLGTGAGDLLVAGGGGFQFLIGRLGTIYRVHGISLLFCFNSS